MGALPLLGLTFTLPPWAKMASSCVYLYRRGANALKTCAQASAKLNYLGRYYCNQHWYTNQAVEADGEFDQMDITELCPFSYNSTSSDTPPNCMCGKPATYMNILCNKCANCADVYLCQPCGQIGRQRYIKEHVFAHSDTRRDPYPTLQEANTAIRVMMVTRTKNYICDCGHSETSRSRMAMHMNTHLMVPLDTCITVCPACTNELEASTPWCTNCLVNGNCFHCQDVYLSPVKHYAQCILESPADTLVCTLCWVQLSHGAEYGHCMLRHLAGNVRCPWPNCNGILESGLEDVWRRHINYAHRVLHCCLVCDYVCPREYQIRKHMTESHIVPIVAHNAMVAAYRQPWSAKLTLPPKTTLGTLPTTEIAKALVYCNLADKVALVYTTEGLDNNVEAMQQTLYEYLDSRDTLIATRCKVDFERLPADMWLLVMENAGPNTRMALAQTCKRMLGWWRHSKHAQEDKWYVTFATMLQLDKSTQLDSPSVTIRVLWALKNHIIRVGDLASGGKLEWRKSKVITLKELVAYAMNTYSDPDDFKKQFLRCAAIAVSR